MHSGVRGDNLEIPPYVNWNPNLRSESGRGTMSGGQFDWGGLLLKSNGGVRRCAQRGRKSRVEYKGKSALNCETHKSSRYESRS